MPSLDEVSPRQWLQMLLTTKMKTYAVFDHVRAGEEIPSTSVSVAEEMVEAGWLERTEKGFAITDDGQRHIDSF